MKTLVLFFFVVGIVMLTVGYNKEVLKKKEAEIHTVEYRFMPHNLYELQNIIARFNPNSKFQTIISCHWDTRPWADMDEQKGNHKQAILGANDGASGVAILLELANILALNPR